MMARLTAVTASPCTQISVLSCAPETDRLVRLPVGAPRPGRGGLTWSRGQWSCHAKSPCGLQLSMFIPAKGQSSRTASTIDAGYKLRQYLQTQHHALGTMFSSFTNLPEMSGRLEDITQDSISVRTYILHTQQDFAFSPTLVLVWQLNQTTWCCSFHFHPVGGVILKFI